MKRFALLAALMTGGVWADALPAEWSGALAVPTGYVFERRVERVRTWDFPEFTVECYHQANGPGTMQRVFVAVPKGNSGKLPAVAVPFYYRRRCWGSTPRRARSFRASRA